MDPSVVFVGLNYGEYGFYIAIIPYRRVGGSILQKNKFTLVFHHQSGVLYSGSNKFTFRRQTGRRTGRRTDGQTDKDNRCPRSETQKNIFLPFDQEKKIE